MQCIDKMEQFSIKGNPKEINEQIEDMIEQERYEKLGSEKLEDDPDSSGPDRPEYDDNGLPNE